MYVCMYVCTRTGKAARPATSTCRSLHNSQDGATVVIVQEFAAGGDLLQYNHCKCSGRMQEARAQSMVVRPLVAALAHLHSCGITHRCGGVDKIGDCSRIP